MKENLLKNCFVQEGTFESKVFPGEVITIKQATVKEKMDYDKIVKENPQDREKSLFFAVEKALISPSNFFTSNMENLTETGLSFIYEVFEQIPLIGKTKKEKEEYAKEYKKAVEEYLENLENKNEEDTKKDEEKK